MPLEAYKVPRPEDIAATLNDGFDDKDAPGLLKHALTEYGNIALVSSFGTESVVLLHMISKIDRNAPVLFLETGMLFPETLEYQRTLAGELGLTNIQVVRPAAEDLAARDPRGVLHQTDTDGCCDIRKVLPLERALTPFAGWITGRKRIHGGQRKALDLAEVEGPRLKINPLAHWTGEEVRGYMDFFELPKHPLVTQGYASVGCAPCTSPTKAGEDPRAGRWRGQDKEECGIHFIDGKVVRG
ncbi:MAG: phosphoadenylyl-sulfate reductase [Maritimibacter harenae]|jgi:phosphoadenosine phosphosulfate reductase|uniref:Adenosine 5'-phosphosulfate reductase n=1 Tax=Maritimibacter harenae TaxID=2606218 RepID=A0A845M5U1_9RHOB|nr:phosphoadenylyl-sulfate reductase [Maritimibacter harenae]MZR13077.1 phosphoadenylyl-sulfate reductase [Maritimibacter harenae]